MMEGADLPFVFSHEVLLRHLTPVFLQRDTGVFLWRFFMAVFLARGSAIWEYPMSSRG